MRLKTRGFMFCVLLFLADVWGCSWAHAYHNRPEWATMPIIVTGITLGIIFLARACYHVGHETNAEKRIRGAGIVPERMRKKDKE